MIITKMALPRRTVLRGAGVMLAMPLLDAMVPALSAMAKTPANAPRRLGFAYLPNGVAKNLKGIDYWTPRGEGKSFELSPILSPLAPFRDQMVVVSGLKQAQAYALGDGNGDHVRATATWLNGVHPKFTQGADVRAGVTADQIAASELGKQTAVASLELGVDVVFLMGLCENGYSCLYLNSLAWRTPTMPLPTETNPRAVFERLFGDGGTPAQRRAEMRKDNSILDLVVEDMARLQKRLGEGDRARADEYLDAVRDVERRIQKAEQSSTDSLPAPGFERPPVGIPDVFGDHVKLMYDLQWLAFRSDITRVTTFMYGRENASRTYPEIGFLDAHHAVSHHGDNPEVIAKYAKVNTYHVQLFAYFLEKLRSTPDGDGTLLDHCLFLFGAGLSDPNMHAHLDLPLLVMGGGSGQSKGGRHVICPPETPMTNLLVTLLDRVGVHPEHLGDSTGRLESLTGV